MVQLLESVNLLQFSEQRASFRLPRCCLGGSSCGDASNRGSAVGGSAIGSSSGSSGHAASSLSRQLRSRQWEGGWHAVLDTLQRSAMRAGMVPPLLAAMYAPAHPGQSNTACAGHSDSTLQVFVS